MGLSGETLTNVRDPAILARCEQFRPTAEQVIRYFNQAQSLDEAKPSAEHYLLKVYDTPCYANGWVSFDDGLEGHFQLFSAGTALISITGQGQPLFFYHGDNDWLDPWANRYHSLQTPYSM